MDKPHNHHRHHRTNHLRFAQLIHQYLFTTYGVIMHKYGQTKEDHPLIDGKKMQIMTAMSR